MRDIYHDELDEIGNKLEAMTQLVQDAMERATNALLDGDLAGAERVISEDPHIDALREDSTSAPSRSSLGSSRWPRIYA